MVKAGGSSSERLAMILLNSLNLYSENWSTAWNVFWWYTFKGLEGLLVIFNLCASQHFGSWTSVNQIKVWTLRKLWLLLHPQISIHTVHIMYVISESSLAAQKPSLRTSALCSPNLIKAMVVTAYRGTNSLMWMNGKHGWKTQDNLSKWVLVILVGE